MKYLKWILVILLIGVLLFLFFKDVDFGEVIGIMGSVNPVYPAAFLVGLFLQLFIRGYRWGIILKPHKEKIPLLTLYNFTVIGFFLNILPGRVGEAAKGILLARRENIKKSYGLASVVLERLIDSFMIVILFLLSLFFIRVDRSPFLLHLRTISFYLLPFIMLLFLVFYLLNLKKIFTYAEKTVYFLSKILPLKIRERAINFSLDFLKGLKLELDAVGYIKLLGFSILVWVFLIPFYWFLMKGFDINISLPETVPFFGIIVASASIPTPGMAGSLHAGSKLGLTKVFNVPDNTAVAYTLLFYFLLMALNVTAGLVSLWMEGINIKNIKNLRNKENEVS